MYEILSQMKYWIFLSSWVVSWAKLISGMRKIDRHGKSAVLSPRLRAKTHYGVQARSHVV